LHTFDYLGDLSAAQWTGIPVDSDALYSGTRVQKITISAFVRHLMYTGHFWIGGDRFLAAGREHASPGKTVRLGRNF